MTRAVARTIATLFAALIIALLAATLAINLAAGCDTSHKAKMKADVAEKSRVASVKAKHIGAIKPKGSVPRPPRAPRSTTKTNQLRAMRTRQYEERQR